MLVREPLLGTRAEVDVQSVNDAADAIERLVLDEVKRLESVFTLFDESSALHELRRAGETDSDEVKAVVALASQWYGRTSGAFHPSMQPLVDVWNQAEARGQAPRANALAIAVAALDATDTQHLDVQALAKGWIADRAVTAAFEQPETPSSVWLSLGGDLVHRGEGSVRVGIENPATPYDNVPPMAMVEVRNEALATSGSARRFWTIGDQRYSKVLDPRTGRPVNRLASATVVAPTAAAADVLATVALVLPVEGVLELAEANNAACYLVGTDGTVNQSSDRFKPA